MVASFTVEGFNGVHIGCAQRTGIAIVYNYFEIKRFIWASEFMAKGDIWRDMNFPNEFSRQPRPFSIIAKWKATE